MRERRRVDKESRVRRMRGETKRVFPGQDSRDAQTEEARRYTEAHTENGRIPTGEADLLGTRQPVRMMTITRDLLRLPCCGPPSGKTGAN
jgi:hypothetical protein